MNHLKSYLFLFGVAGASTAGTAGTSSAAALMVDMTPREPATAAAKPAANNPRRGIDTCPSS